MKFMQRAAAAAAASPSSPGVSQPEDERPSKRVKKEFGSSPRTPQAQTLLFDQKAAQAALEAEEQKREALIERQAEKLGDAHWRLDPTKLPGSDRRKGVPLKIVQVGFSQIDRSDTLATRQSESDGTALQSYQPNKSKTVNEEVRVPAPFDGTISLIYFYRMIAQIAILTLTLTLILLPTPMICRTLLVELPVRWKVASHLVGPVTAPRSVNN